MRQLDSIWQEQQVFLPRLTLDTEAPSKATSQMVIKIRNKRRPAVFDADPQAAARAIQASFGVKTCKRLPVRVLLMPCMWCTQAIGIKASCYKNCGVPRSASWVYERQALARPAMPCTTMMPQDCGGECLPSACAFNPHQQAVSTISTGCSCAKGLSRCRQCRDLEWPTC